MKSKVVLILLLLVAAGCGANSGLSKLNDIERLVQERPDSALACLGEIGQGELTGAKEKALYSLLYSIALDKNYIDVKSDSLIRQAADYYSYHGDVYHRFLTFYYQGRVYENAEQYSAAMDAFLKAGKYIGKKIPDKNVASFYSVKARVYYKQFALDMALEETMKSKHFAAGLDNPMFYIRNSLDIAALQIVRKDYQKAAEELLSLEKWLKENKIPVPVEYYESRLRIAIGDTTETKESIIDKLESYASKCDSFSIQPKYLLLAQIYTKTSNINEAEKALDKYHFDPSACSGFEKIQYYSELFELNRAKGRFEEALNAELIYQELIENFHNSVFNNDVRFIEERYKNALKAEKSLRLRIGLSLLVALLLAGIVALIAVFKKRADSYKRAVSEAQSEYKFITEMMDDGHGHGELKDTLEKRIKTLRPYLYSDKFSPNVFASRKDIEHIDEGRKELLRSVGMVYALSYKDFVSRLLDYGLTAEEVGLCALYVSGYSLKEMNDYLHTGSIIHINGNIRKKIGPSIEGLKLHTWLKQVFLQTEQS